MDRTLRSKLSALWLTLLVVFSTLSPSFAQPTADEEATAAAEKQKEKEEELEQTVFLVLSASTTILGLGFAESLFRVSAARENREKIKLELAQKQAQLTEWAHHKDNLCAECEAISVEVERLRRTLPEGKLNHADKQKKKEMEARIAFLDQQLAKMRGRMEQSPSAYTKIVNNIMQLDQLDNQLDSHFEKLLALAKEKKPGNLQKLREAVKAWRDGKGISAFEAWLRTNDAQEMMRDGRAVAWSNDLEKIMIEGGEKVKNAVELYNTIATERNKVLPNKKKLPMIDYRKTQLGHDTRNYDTRVDPQVPKSNSGGQSISMDRAGFSKMAEVECGAGHEELVAEVKKLEKRTGFAYTYRDQLTRLGVGGVSGVGLIGVNQYSYSRHNKTAEEIKKDRDNNKDIIKQAEIGIAGQMRVEKAAGNRFQPFYDLATRVISENIDQMTADIEKSFDEDPNRDYRIELVRKQIAKSRDPKNIQKNLENALADLMIKKEMTTIDQMIAALYTKDAGERVTIVQAYVEALTQDVVNNLYRGTSEEQAINRLQFNTMHDIVEEILNGTKPTRAKVVPKAEPVVPLPGITPPAATPVGKHDAGVPGSPLSYKPQTEDLSRSIVTVTPMPPASGASTGIAVGTGSPLVVP